MTDDEQPSDSIEDMEGLAIVNASDLIPSKELRPLTQDHLPFDDDLSIPAHPVNVCEDIGWAGTSDYDGLTKRELFAAMAMQGMMANPELSLDVCDLVAHAKMRADALLKSLEGGES